MNTSIQYTNKVDREALESKVKDMYKKVALHPEVSYHFEMGRTLAERLGYPASILDNIPAAAIESFAGVGYYFDFADLKEGESVVDLGSGSGMDVFYAAEKVGLHGEVIGIDMTKEQLEKSRMLKELAGYTQVHFRDSYIEELPVVSDSVDVLISNGVINLSSDKREVFREVARTLKSGGRMVLSDIVTTESLPTKISCNADLWAACIGGAITQEDYCQLIESAGMQIIKIKNNPYAFISNNAKGATQKYGIKSISILAINK